MADTPVTAPAAQPTQAAPEVSQTTETPVQAEARRLKVKINGAEQELPEDEVIAGYQLAQVSRAKMEEAAKSRKEAERFFNMVKDPAQLRKILEDPRVGVDVKKWAQEIVWEQMQEESLTPDQRKQRDIQRELDRYRQNEKAQKEQAERTQHQQLVEKYEADYENTITSALQSGGVPRTKATVQRMAYYLQMSLQNGFDLTPQDLVGRVRQDYIDEARELFGAADGDSLSSWLGDDTIKKIRETDLKKLKAKENARFATPPAKPASQRKPVEKSDQKSYKDWKSDLEDGWMKRK